MDFGGQFGMTMAAALIAVMLAGAGALWFPGEPEVEHVAAVGYIR